MSPLGTAGTGSGRSLGMPGQAALRSLPTGWQCRDAGGLAWPLSTPTSWHHTSHWFPSFSFPSTAGQRVRRVAPAPSLSPPTCRRHPGSGVAKGEERPAQILMPVGFHFCRRDGNCAGAAVVSPRQPPPKRRDPASAGGDSTRGLPQLCPHGSATTSPMALPPPASLGLSPCPWLV